MRDFRDLPQIRPVSSEVGKMLPSISDRENVSVFFNTRLLHTSTNKNRVAVCVVHWQPDAKRILTGSNDGELTLWGGMNFNFEAMIQAHAEPLRDMRWTRDGQWLVTAGGGGQIMYWHSNFNMVKSLAPHGSAGINSIALSPTELKLVTASDDKTLRLVDFHSGETERSFEGHGSAVVTVGYHPSKSLVLSGAGDKAVKLWDCRSAKVLKTLFGHKDAVTAVAWHWNGTQFATGSKDNLIKLYDLRMLTELKTWNSSRSLGEGARAEVTCLDFHPFVEGLLASGSHYLAPGTVDKAKPTHSGNIHFWTHASSSPAATVYDAHDNMVSSLRWHPLGHVLCSGSRDQQTRFWVRNRPGDDMVDAYNFRSLPDGFAKWKAAKLQAALDEEKEAIAASAKNEKDAREGNPVTSATTTFRGWNKDKEKADLAVAQAHAAQAQALAQAQHGHLPGVFDAKVTVPGLGAAQDVPDRHHRRHVDDDDGDGDDHHNDDHHNDLDDEEYYAALDEEEELQQAAKKQKKDP